MTTAKQSNSERDARVNALADVVGYRLEELFEALGVTLRLRGKMYAGRCPVHGGDNPSAFNIFPDGYAIRGNWKCRTRGCDRHFKPTVIGFARGVLSHQRYGWAHPGDAEVSFKEAVDWLCRFAGAGLGEMEVDLVEVEKRKFAAGCAVLGRAPQEQLEGWQRDTFRRAVTMPSPYYLGRGYSREILERYDVGESKTPDPANPMYRRAVVPIYDRDYRRVVGVTGRSLLPQCPSCGLWHSGACPDPGDPRASKWYHMGCKGEALHKDSHLYNYWFAKDAVKETGVVVLVEGPGDVWRLEEAGVRNSVALFGVALNDPQQVVLERSGALTIVAITDMDEAGDDARDDIQEALGGTYRLLFPDLPEKDVGAMTVEQIRSGLVPLLKRLENP